MHFRASSKDFSPRGKTEEHSQDFVQGAKIPPPKTEKSSDLAYYFWVDPSVILFYFIFQPWGGHGYCGTLATSTRRRGNHGIGVVHELLSERGF